MPTLVTRTYLELRSPEDLRPAPMPRPAPRIERIGECPPSFYRYLYAEVGRAFHWTDRLRWSDETLRAHLAPGLALWLHTCTLDHPAALANCLQRGFVPVREETCTADV